MEVTGMSLGSMVTHLEITGMSLDQMVMFKDKYWKKLWEQHGKP